MLEPGVRHHLTLNCRVDENWAGCTLARRSTSGVHLQFLGASVHFCSKTQSVVALSSAESELYGIGLGVAESLHVRSFLLEANLASSVNIEIFTDSSAAKSIANALT